MRTRLTEKELKENHVEAQRRWRKRHPEKSKAAAEKRKEDGRKRRIEVIKHYGNKCKCCSEKEFKFLAIDHINGKGKKHRFSVCSGSSDAFYRWIVKNYPDYLQVLCHNCNLAKGFYGKCPHKIED